MNPAENGKRTAPLPSLEQSSAEYSFLCRGPTTPTHMMMKPHFESFSRSSSSASTWNRLSHIYRELHLVSLLLEAGTVQNFDPLYDSRVDRLEWCQSERNLLLLAFLIQDCPDEHTQPIIRHSVEELEFLLGRGDSG
jgi:hypothetical protein